MYFFFFKDTRTRSLENYGTGREIICDTPKTITSNIYIRMYERYVPYISNYFLPLFLVPYGKNSE